MRPPTTEERLLLEQATTQYQQDLASDHEAQQYLTKRGFDQQAAWAARYGVVRHALVGHEGFAGRLVVPYLTAGGVVNLRFRCLKQHVCKDEGCPKYLGAEGRDTNLYGVLDLRRNSPFICVTEGELDRDTLSLLCGLPAVGVAGVENWKSHFGRCLDDFPTKYVFADGDKAGRKFGSFMAKEAGARPVRMPDGHDVNSLFLTGGASALKALIDPKV